MRARPSRLLASSAAIACALGLAACGGGGSPATQTGRTTSPPPGAVDSSICQIVTQATAAYNAKNFTAWRADLAQIASAASSAQYLPLKRYAEEIKSALGTTTTTASRTKQQVRHATDDLIQELGGYVGLQHVCASLPT